MAADPILFQTEMVSIVIVTYHHVHALFAMRLLRCLRLDQIRLPQLKPEWNLRIKVIRVSLPVIEAFISLQLLLSEFIMMAMPQ
jgi:hypothetical protein